MLVQSLSLRLTPLQVPNASELEEMAALGRNGDGTVDYRAIMATLFT